MQRRVRLRRPGGIVCARRYNARVRQRKLWTKCQHNIFTFHIKRTGLVLGIEDSDNTVGEDGVNAAILSARYYMQNECAYRL